MKKTKENYLIKGDYLYAQASRYFTVKQYMIVEQEGKRCLLLRFRNDSEMTVTGVEFTVKQMDAKGHPVGNVTVQYSDMSVRPGALYCPEQGIVVSDHCVDCMILMRYVICGKIKYAFKKGHVSAHYDKRGYVMVKKEKTKKKSRSHVEQRYAGGGWFYRLIALVTLILVLFSLYFVMYRAEREEQERSSRDQWSEQYQKGR